MGTYVSIHREIMEHWLWDEKPFSQGQAWIDLILMANHKPTKFVCHDHIVVGQRGCVYRSVSTLSKRWGWNRKKVTKFLRMLQDDEMVILDLNPQQTVIRIKNYDNYQFKKDSDSFVRFGDDGTATGTAGGTAIGTADGTAKTAVNKGVTASDGTATGTATGTADGTTDGTATLEETAKFDDGTAIGTATGTAKSPTIIGFVAPGGTAIGTADGTAVQNGSGAEIIAFKNGTAGGTTEPPSGKAIPRYEGQQLGQRLDTYNKYNIYNKINYSDNKEIDNNNKNNNNICAKTEFGTCADDEERKETIDSGRESEHKSSQNYSADFEEMWKIYPRKVSKQKAYRCYVARLNSGFSPDEILLATKNYAAECKKDHTPEKYIKHCSTFLSVDTPFADYLPRENKVDPVAETADGNPFAEYMGW